jgi:hypothetical protein
VPESTRKRYVFGGMMSYEQPWGDEVGEGWQTAVMQCHQQLKHLDSDYRISQIKEKFGGLRYYFVSSYDAGYIVHDIMDAVVHVAEYRCSITCEVCGADGKIRHNFGHAKTLCNIHALEQR